MFIVLLIEGFLKILPKPKQKVFLHSSTPSGKDSIIRVWDLTIFRLQTRFCCFPLLYTLIVADTILSAEWKFALCAASLFHCYCPWLDLAINSCCSFIVMEAVRENLRHLQAICTEQTFVPGVRKRFSAFMARKARYVTANWRSLCFYIITSGLQLRVFMSNKLVLWNHRFFSLILHLQRSQPETRVWSLGWSREACCISNWIMTLRPSKHIAFLVINSL